MKLACLQFGPLALEVVDDDHGRRQAVDEQRVQVEAVDEGDTVEEIDR